MKRTLILLAVSALAIVCGACSGKSESPNVVLVTIDTLRYDHLGCYGYAKAKTPVIDRLAREGVMFETCVSPAPLTLPSHTTMMTGQLPPVHGVRNNGLFKLPENAVTVAERFQAEGYRTGAFIGSFPLIAKFGLDQGFETFDDDMSKITKYERNMFLNERRAEDVIQPAMRWLDSPDERPFFLWVHLFDPHFPYNPPEPFRNQFPPDPDETIPSEMRVFPVYDGEIAYTDAQLARLVTRLEQISGRSVLLALTSDHGESLGEHDEVTHGTFVYETTMHVPLVFWASDQRYPPHTVSGRVGLVDLAQTLLEMAGLEVPRAFQGHSLLPQLEKETKAPDALYYGESMAPKHHYAWAPPFTLWNGPWKYIELPKPELYHLGRDPHETQNLLSESSQTASMKQALSVFRMQLAEKESETVALSDEEKARLESLGYVGSIHSNALDMSDERDPKDFIHVLLLIAKALKAVRDGENEEAFDTFEAALKADPLNVFVRKKYIEFLDGSGEVEKVKEQVNHLLKQGQDSASLHYYLGRTYEQENNPEAAEREYLKAIEMNPESAVAHGQLGFLYGQTGRQNLAEQSFQRALELDPHAAATHSSYGFLLKDTGRFELALASFEKALALHHDTWEIRNAMGLAYANLQQYHQAFEMLERSIVLSPETPDPYLNLAVVKAASGDKNAARHFLGILQSKTKDPGLLLKAELLLQRLGP